MFTISPGHYGKGTGAVGLLDEVTEAKRIAEQVVKQLQARGVKAQYVADVQSKNQHDNIRYLVNSHNETSRTHDISIHFNSSAQKTEQGIGTEVLYVNPAMENEAIQLSTAIANAAQLKNRGAKRRADLGFLNGTTKKALIIEVCFVNSKQDVTLYERHATQIVEAIVNVLCSWLPTETERVFSSPALQQKIEALWQDKQTIARQLKQGIAQNAFHTSWLEKFERGELTLIDYVALTTLQFQKKI